MQDPAPQTTITRDQLREQIRQTIQDGIAGTEPGRVTVTREAPVGIATTQLPPPWPTDVPPRLAQLNQAVESIAIEVERISEGQRFTTRLLSEQHQLPAATNRNIS